MCYKQVHGQRLLIQNGQLNAEVIAPIVAALGADLNAATEQSGTKKNLYAKVGSLVIADK
ncbi:hypothetical protein [Thiosulfatimonas sediminis]|uniref:hypothetical protein n=1 Tax=Thiosulfatimonas sediminis TaxID=2675054 RepID=UPI0015658D19|nr:hypothetical protein [Thiosulfatimonas sediminis]